ncbi:MAG TPA: hypothetical protein VK610_01730 [Rhodothermales bacterium]|nr:hypothetical protein [Rhodothermales bacterium]
MTPSLHALLPLLDPALGAALASPEARARLAAALARLPLVAHGGLEVRLGAAAGPVDLALHVGPEDGGYAALAEGTGFRDAGPDEGAPGAGSAWARLRAFAAAAAADPRLREAAPSAWIEYDLDGGAADTAPADAAGKAAKAPSVAHTLAAPNLFLRVGDVAVRPAARGPRAAPQQAEAVARLTDVLSGLGLDPDEAPVRPDGAPGETGRETMVRVFRALPASAEMGFLGVLLGRETRGMRLALRDFPLSELTAFLDVVGWPHSHRLLLPLLHVVRDHTDRVDLQLDVQGGVHGPLGLEVALARDPADAPRARPFLGALVRAGLATSDQTDALLAWPAEVTRYGGGEGAAALWPKGLDAPAVRRTLNHVKLTFDPGAAGALARGAEVPSLAASVAAGRLRAKAYLAFTAGRASLHPARW